MFKKKKQKEIGAWDILYFNNGEYTVSSVSRGYNEVGQSRILIEAFQR